MYRPNFPSTPPHALLFLKCPSCQEMPSLFEGPWQMYFCLGLVLFLTSFGITTFVTAIFCTFLFCIGNGWNQANQLVDEFNKVEASFSTGIATLVRPIKNDPPREEMTGSAILDLILEEIIGYAMRDFVDSWYGSISSDDKFRKSLERSARRTIATSSSCLQKVDWVPLLTRHIVDDFASHLRLYRKAKEKIAGSDREMNLDSVFFDLELEMEKSYCRGLVSTSRRYEEAYLHELADILLYLLTPPEDFRCRPLRILLRELLAKRILMPMLDQFSDPDYINCTIVWLLSDVPIDYEDFVVLLENSENVEELKAIGDSLEEEIALQRSRDTGDQDQTTSAKQQLTSLQFTRSLATDRIEFLTDFGKEVRGTLSIPVCDLSLQFILANGISLSYFIEFLQSVGGQNYIDCFLAIEGYRVSCEHQLARLKHSHQLLDLDEIYETIREAANFLHHQYLSEEAIDKVPLDDGLITKLAWRMKNETPSNNWFDSVHDKIVEVLQKDGRFYPSFRKSRLYRSMLADLNMTDSDADELDIFPQKRTPSPCPQLDVISTRTGSDMSNEDEDVETYRIMAEISTLGIGRQGSQTFALYNVRVNRENGRGEQMAFWNVLRRYSDFHTLHTVVKNKCPNLANLSFPGKKTFNNLHPDFLEKRKMALNRYLSTLLDSDIMSGNAQLEQIVMHFLSRKQYAGEKGLLSMKTVSAMFTPLCSGVRAFGTAVTTVPETVLDGVVRVSDELNRAAKQVLGPSSSSSSSSPPPPPPPPPSPPTRPAARVGADLEHSTDSIPLRILLLLVDEVFGLRRRNQWFRRRLVAFLRQFVHATFGSSLNRKIVDLVVWLTGEMQVSDVILACGDRSLHVAEYLRALRDALWPDGRLRANVQSRSRATQLRTDVVTRAKMLAMLPDELRLFIGDRTSRSGVKMVADALHDVRLNRRLICVLLERLLVDLFPDNRFERVLPRLHGKRPTSAEDRQ